MRVDLFTIPVTDPLSLYATSIFRLRARDAYATETIMPGGHVNLLFNFGPPVRVTGLSSTPIFTWSSAIIAGLQTRPYTSRPDHDVHTMGVSLRSSTSFAVLDTRLDGLTNGCVDASVLFDDTDRLMSQLAETPSFQAQCGILVAWLRCRARIDDTGRLVYEACRLLGLDSASGAVQRVATRLGKSPRQLQRLFTERVGTSPAQYVQLARFARALPLISSSRSLTDVAAAAGYFDQAHFCHDFRGFAAMTPDEYRRAAPKVPGLIYA